ncbi:MAG TPA: protein translocase subunit SecF [Rhizomicrobium sp.]|jgi:preprotein translocase subunit SecF|nr:protein translocase subunit SecF [Rhizomicrobium sp.]
MPLLRFIPEATDIDFVGLRYFAFAIDGLLLLISIVSIAVLHFNLGIDFKGGVLMEMKAAQVIDLGKMRADIISLHFDDQSVQTYYGGGECDKPRGSCAMIRVLPRTAKAGENQNTIDQSAVSSIRDKLGNGYNIRSQAVVGPKVSGELLHDGVVATLLAIAMIAIYVSVRFEWQYGIGAAIATGHDVLVTAGLFSVLQLDFSLTSIAALLTLAGYSINDTVVVFDRIRENRRKYKRMKLGDLINLSTNQMVTRTILTSLATAMSLIPMYFFGGPNLADFSGPILFGIVIGTFSSTYVAAALLLYLPAPAGSVEGPAEATV